MCHGPHFISSPYPCHYLPALFQRARYTVAVVCLLPPLSLGPAPGPCRHFVKFSSFVCLSPVFSRSQGSLEPRPAPHALTLSNNFVPAGENPIHLYNLPSSAVRLWGLAHWGHDHSSAGRAWTFRLPFTAEALTAPSCVTSLLAPLTMTPVRRGRTHAVFLWLTRQRMCCTGGFATPGRGQHARVCPCPHSL